MLNPRTLQLVMDSLRYWVLEMHVDGFRFDLAAALARGLAVPFVDAGALIGVSEIDGIHYDEPAMAALAQALAQAVTDHFD